MLVIYETLRTTGDSCRGHACGESGSMWQREGVRQLHCLLVDKGQCNQDQAIGGGQVDGGSNQATSS